MYFKSPQLHWQINKSIRFYSIHKGSDNKKEGNKELDLRGLRGFGLQFHSLKWCLYRQIAHSCHSINDSLIL